MPFGVASTQRLSTLRSSSSRMRPNRGCVAPPPSQESLYFFGERRTDKSSSSKFQGIETPSQVRSLFQGFCKRARGISTCHSSHGPLTRLMIMWQYSDALGQALLPIAEAQSPTSDAKPCDLPRTFYLAFYICYCF